MKAVCDALFKLPEFGELTRRIENERTPVLLCGLSPIHKAHIIAAVRRKFGRPCFIICADERAAGQLIPDTSSLSGEEAFLLVPREFVFYNADGVSREYEHKRLGILSQTKKLPLVFMTAESAVMRTLPPEYLDKAVIELKVGDEIDPDSLRDALINSGYSVTEAIDARSGGQFAVRGEIIDVYPVNSEFPIRIDVSFDSIDSISYFNTETQRRTEQLNSYSILPAAELLPHLSDGGIEGVCSRIENILNSKDKKKLSDKQRSSLYADIEKLQNLGLYTSADRLFEFIYPEFTCALDYLPDDAIVFIDEPSVFSEKLRNITWQSGQDTEALLENGLISFCQTKYYLTPEESFASVTAHTLLQLDSFTSGKYDIPPKAIYSLLVRQLSGYAGSLQLASEDIRSYLSRGYSVVFCCGSASRATHVAETLRSEEIEGSFLTAPAVQLIPGKLIYTDSALSTGAEYPALKLAILTEGQLSPRKKSTEQKSAKKKNQSPIRSFTDLHNGDLIVHDSYGIGRFGGIQPLDVDGIRKDFIKIQYLGSDVLYVPVTQLDLIAKYIGAPEESGVKLSRMGGGEWVKARARAKSAARDLAKQLIELYAARRRTKGFAFPPDNEWQKEFEESFEYDETDDQLRTTSEIKADMETEIPMDRLLCGDVGFGKTEVAFRAVMKCILGGKQAAILVPTTVLARQHYQTAIHRFNKYPLKIGILSRFTPPSKTSEYLRMIKNGQLDLVIGTHKLLAKNISFYNLGLLVIDEEQRFGVGHKERLKEIAKSVDVLTLTATPIPRTLNMALSGIRDMSVLEDAPHNRHPVQTYVLEHDWSILGDAISRELARGGQVYYLHNRVESISRVAAKIKSMFPDAVVAVGHGQMKDDELSDVMRSVVIGDVQILVCTTIIETGIDIPNVNTLIIDDADKMGLAQLHQIRGRVGRSSRHAYAYLTYFKGKVLSEIATKRLSTIREFAEFGAGFQIAMRDLEIRGAGNVLGAEQSGHMISVGYDMYLRLLDEAVTEEKGEEPKKRVECTVDISIPARISEKYIPSASERLDIYRRIAYIRSQEDAGDMTDELYDRYGDFSDEVQNLINIALLRNIASEAGICEITERNRLMNFKLVSPDFMKISALCVLPEFKGRVMINAGSVPYISLRIKDGENRIKLAMTLAEKMRDLV